MKTLEETIAVFDLKSLRATVSVYKCLLRNGYTITDLVEYFDKLITQTVENRAKFEEEVRKGREQWAAVAPPCPKCSAPLFLKRICKKQGPENIHGWTCLWYCEHGDCIYERYTYENATDEIKKIKERSKKNGII